MIYFLLIFVIVFISIFLIDLVPEFNVWQSRIKIGRFTSPEIWQKKVGTISKKWLQNMPTVPITDNKRLIIIDILRKNYKKAAIQSWQEGALILGLTSYVKKTGDAKVKDEILNFVSTKMTDSGHWKIKPMETDQALIAYAFLQTDFLDPHQYKPAFDATYQMILSLKGEDGTIAYKNHVREYRFVDTIGFISPFLVNYGLKFNVPEAIELALKQILEFHQFGMLPNHLIPCHTYNVQTKIPTGLFGWGRGLGWFLIGIADSYRALPPDHPQKKVLKNLILQVMDSLLKFQLKDGSFTWLIFDDRSRKDSSTVATVAYFLTVVAEIPELTAACVSGKEKCLTYLRSVTQRNGAVDFSQGDTKGIGVYSQNFGILPFTQGFVLRTICYACEEINNA